MAVPARQAVQEGATPQYPGGHEDTQEAEPLAENRPMGQERQAEREEDPLTGL